MTISCLSPFSHGHQLSVTILTTISCLSPFSLTSAVWHQSHDHQLSVTILTTISCLSHSHDHQLSFPYSPQHSQAKVYKAPTQHSLQLGCVSTIVLTALNILTLGFTGSHSTLSQLGCVCVSNHSHSPQHSHTRVYKAHTQHSHS
jgi:hypothetical protein